MRTVELTYRYGAPEAAVRPRPADPASRLSDGNRAFASAALVA